jgi:hypothetical protein
METQPLTTDDIISKTTFPPLITWLIVNTTDQPINRLRFVNVLKADRAAHIENGSSWAS